MGTAHWPLHELCVSTPLLELRPPDEATEAALIDLARAGIHDADYMPFDRPWSIVPSPQFERQCFQYFARCWAELTPDHWDIPLAVWHEGEPVGVQGIHADGFVAGRVFATGSWLGQAHQGKGIGKEMRAAVLHLGFAGFEAVRAETAAYEDNERSLAVTRALGYRDNGDRLVATEKGRRRQTEFALAREDWERTRRTDITIEGLADCLDLLGLT
jgi:RimJ/RimL family protein N-acetyltransferase